MSSESTKLPKTDENLKTISKYFLHGLAFTVILYGLTFVWTSILPFLTAIVLRIGLMIGFIVFIFVLGGLNSFLAQNIWSFSIKTRWTSLLGHGVVLLIGLITTYIPYIIIERIWPSFTYSMLFFEVFINGIVAKNVASQWKESYQEETSAREF